MSTIASLLVNISADISGFADEVEKARKIKKALERDMETGKKISLALETPSEKYRREVAELNRLFKAGAVNAETFDRALKKINDDLNGKQPSFGKDFLGGLPGGGSLNSLLAGGTAGVAAAGVTKLIDLFTSVATSAVHAAGAMAEYARGVADAIDEDAKLADRLGLTTEALAGIKLGGALAGVEGPELETSIGHMMRSVGQLMAGNKETADTFKQLGLSAEDFIGLNTGDQLGLIADKINELDDPTKKAIALFEVFGKSGQKMFSLLADGSKGLKDSQAEAQRFGLTVTRKQAADVEAANDAWTRLGQAIKGNVTQAVVELAPVFEGVANALTEMLTVTDDNKNAFSEFAKAVEVSAVSIGAAIDEIRAAASRFNLTDLLTKNSGQILGEQALGRIVGGGDHSIARRIQDAIDNARSGVRKPSLTGGATAAEDRKAFLAMVNESQGEIDKLLEKREQLSKQFAGGAFHKEFGAEAGAKFFAAIEKNTDDLRKAIGNIETPAEKYVTSLEKLHKVLDVAGADIDEGRAVRQLHEELEKTLGLSNPVEEFSRKLGHLTEAAQADPLIDVAGGMRQLNEELRKSLGLDPKPLEEYTKTVELLQQALGAGGIGKEDFSEGLKKARRGLLGAFGVEENPVQAFFDQIQKAQANLGGGDLGLAGLAALKGLEGKVGIGSGSVLSGAQEAGSREALSTMLRAQAGAGGENVQERIRQALDLANKQREMQLKKADEMAKALDKLKQPLAAKFLP